MEKKVKKTTFSNDPEDVVSESIKKKCVSIFGFFLKEWKNKDNPLNLIIFNKKYIWLITIYKIQVKIYTFFITLIIIQSIVRLFDNLV